MTYAVRRLNHVASTKTSNVDKKSSEGETVVRLCNYTDVYKNASITTDMDFMVATATKDQVSKFGLKAGDTVFTKDSETADDIGIPAYVAESASDLVCGYHLAIARAFDGETDPRFLYWCLASPEAAQQWSVLASGVTRVGLRQADIGKLEVPSPPFDIQRKIAAFLDRETAQIDDLIGKQERLIELLAEKRQAIVAHAVTKGLDPAIPTRPSGIPWIGSIPEHWTIPQLGMHARIGNGSTPNRDTAAYWSDGDIPWLNSSQVNRDEIIEADQFVTESATAECHLPLVGAGSLLVGLTGRTRGMTSILRFPATINQHVAYVTPEPSVWNPEYVLWFLRSSYDRLRELSDENGSTKGALTCTALKKMSIALPPLSEQTEIVDSVAEHLERIRSIVVASTDAIALLRERRSALISAAVTGRLPLGA